MKRRRALLLGLLIALISSGIWTWTLATRPGLQSDDAADSTATPPASPKEYSKPKPETEDEKIRRMLLGVWQDEYQGKRTMTLNEDGSGTMFVELSGVQAYLFASKLRFDMTWSLDGKKLTKKTVDGEPSDKVNLILNTMGDTAEDTLLEITEDRLLLLDQNGTTQYDWKRITQDQPSSPWPKGQNK